MWRRSTSSGSSSAKPRSIRWAMAAPCSRRFGEGAWFVGEGEARAANLGPCAFERLQEIYQRPEFAKSLEILNHIKNVLASPCFNSMTTAAGC